MTNKTARLIALPLWECGGCGRLEFLTLHPRCPKLLCVQCGCFMNAAKKDSLSIFEAIGQHFHRDTGLVRPGKDCRVHDSEYRGNMFDKWNESDVEDNKGVVAKAAACYALMSAELNRLKRCIDLNREEKDNPEV